MPRQRPTVASFYVIRREEFPNVDPALYFTLLGILDRSCKRVGLRHVVLTDPETVAHPSWPAGVEHHAFEGLPRPLMQCTTEIQARYLESGPGHDVLFVGADCIMLADPSKRLPADTRSTMDFS